ncbi:hypothetical protein GJAV_G00177960 [Gymnothorax javanicus]|nr:hypothetical protein GJAV_G00177960 [Gymnothorax javanicus]
MNTRGITRKCLHEKRSLKDHHVGNSAMCWPFRDNDPPLPEDGMATLLVRCCRREGHLHSCSSVNGHAHSMRCEAGSLWEALAHYYADSDGVLSLSRDKAQGGSFSGCEPMGLFWSLHPAPGEMEGLRLRKKNVETPYTVQVSLLNGHVSSKGIKAHDGVQGIGEELASVTVERWYMAPGVRRIDIRDKGLVGTMFLPPGPGPFPAVLDLWGMGGGLMEYRAALLASRGMASFSLAYFDHKDLPGPRNLINVGDDYLQAAFELLQNHPQVCGSRVAVIGLSFGVYLTFRLAAHLPVNPRCIIVINGPIVCQYQPIQVNGKIIRFAENKLILSRDHAGYVDFMEASFPGPSLASTKIKVENLRCPVLLFTSEDDHSCAALENATEIKKSLEAANKSHLLTWMLYPGTGHLLEPPYMPNARTALFATKPTKLMVLWGGHPAPHAAAQEDSWKKILEFLECHLRGVD